MNGQNGNTDRGTFRKIENGDARAAFEWNAAMRQAGFSYSQTQKIVHFRTGLDAAEWDELLREGADG